MAALLAGGADTASPITLGASGFCLASGGKERIMQPLERLVQISHSSQLFVEQFFRFHNRLRTGPQPAITGRVLTKRSSPSFNIFPLLIYGILIILYLSNGSISPCISRAAVFTRGFSGRKRQRLIEHAVKLFLAFRINVDFANPQADPAIRPAV